VPDNPSPGIGSLRWVPIHPIMIHAFPAGRVGIALLLVRIYVTTVAFEWIVQCGPADLWSCVVIGGLGVCVFLGLLARWAAGALLIFGVASILRGILSPSAALQSFVLIAVALAGSGALSMDSWIFGRQVIRIRP
jgi:hypothetical protein